MGLTFFQQESILFKTVGYFTPWWLCNTVEDL